MKDTTRRFYDRWVPSQPERMSEEIFVSLCHRETPIVAVSWKNFLAEREYTEMLEALLQIDEEPEQ